MKTTFPDARILIIDDDKANLLLLERMLEHKGCTNLHSFSSPLQALADCVHHEPDLVILDLMMPEMDGFEVMERLTRIVPNDSFVPVLIITADVTAETKRRALAAAAMDYLNKPVDYDELVLRARNLLATRSLYLQLRTENQTLEERVARRTADLMQSRRETLLRLARAAEFRDDDTGQHTQRVGDTAALLAQGLGLPAEQIQLIRETAPLHDVGKIAIPDSILLKPGKLTAEEFDVIKTHTKVGAELLAGGESVLMKVAERIALSHHERWDGSGYPHGHAGEDIPLEGRIVAVADVFDALIHERPYKMAWPVNEAVAEIAAQSGRQFDPQVVTAFLKLPHERLVAATPSSHHLDARHLDARDLDARHPGGHRPSAFSPGTAAYAVAMLPTAAMAYAALAAITI